MFTVTNLENSVLLATPDFTTAWTAMNAADKAEPDVCKRPHIDAVMDYPNAIGFMNSLRGYSWFFRVYFFAPTLVDAQRGFTLHGSVPTTRKEALRILDIMYGTRFKVECSVRFAVYRDSVFVG